jgi:hypothetical protein
MVRIAGWLFFAGCICFEAVAGMPEAAPQLTAAQIVEKNVAARGGLEAWRKVETMSWVGHVETGTAAGASLPFLLEMKRPSKTRFAINSPQQVSMRLFDGKRGWKLRLTNNGQPDVQPYSPAETAFAQDGQVIDGPLMDYQAKGADVALEAVDEIDGSKAYRLGVKLPSGRSQRVWINAQSFLEIKSERESRHASGMPMTATKFYRNYQAVGGLQIPFLIESSAGAGRITDRMVIEKVVLNPPLDDRIFAKPPVSGRPPLMSMGGDTPQMANRPRGPGAGFPERARPILGSMPGSGNAQ